ncbi:MAG: hypothetical protein ACOYL3_12010 [Desulfuromonadaceae bacterium]
MKLSPTLRTLTLLAALSLPATAALAAYTQEASTFSAGGGVTTSAGYENLGVIGQPGIVGSSASTGYTANHGFLSVLGDGFKILYPVIAATPGSFTFSLVAGTTSTGQSLGISNTGGSTLNWTVAKNTADPSNIFSFTPSTGSNSGTVTVSANAATLTPGTYSNTLTVSGAGIDQTMLVQLDLTVSAPALYTLAVTLKLATPGKGGGTVTSTVPDGRLSCQRTGGASDVTCSADFLSGTITLHQTPDSNTTMATWGAPGCGRNQTCQIVLNTPQGTDVTFPYSSMAKINLGTGYESLVLAYSGAGASDDIKARAVTFSETGGVVSLVGSKTINLIGGLDAYFNAVSGGYTTIQGRLNIGGTGRVNIKAVKIHP